MSEGEKMGRIIIEDSDRDAAADLASNPDSGLPGFIADPIRAGEMDWHPLVQAFSACRLQERERAAKVLRDEIAKLEKQYDQHQHVSTANQKIGIARCLMKVEAPERAASLKKTFAAAIRGQS